jgi:hypothetical protein
VEPRSAALFHRRTLAAAPKRPASVAASRPPSHTFEAFTRIDLSALCDHLHPAGQDVLKGDPILMATRPDAVNPDGSSVLTTTDRDTGQVGPSGFGREVQFLQNNGYTYNESSGTMSR